MLPFGECPSRPWCWAARIIPFAGAISRCFAPGTPLIDGNLGTARQLRRRLEEEGLLSPGPGGAVSFHSSQEGGEAEARMRCMLKLWQETTERV